MESDNIENILLKLEDGKCIIGFSNVEKNAIFYPQLIFKFVKLLIKTKLANQVIIDLRKSEAVYDDIHNLIDYFNRKELTILSNVKRKSITKEYIKKYGNIVIPVSNSLRINPKKYEIDEFWLYECMDSVNRKKEPDTLYKSSFEIFKEELYKSYTDDSVSSLLMISRINDRFKVLPCHGLALFDIGDNKQNSLFKPLRYSPLKYASYREIIEKFELLINSKGLKESNIQDYIEEFPQILSGIFPEGAYIIPQLTLKRDNKRDLCPDFFIKPYDERFLQLADLKLPKEKIVIEKTNRNRFSSAVYDGIAQLREYASYFDNYSERDKFKKMLIAMGLNADVDCYKPISTLIIGNDSSWKSNDAIIREMRTSYADIELITYNELIRKTKNRLLI